NKCSKKAVPLSLRAIEESVAISLKTNRLMPFLKRLLHRFALRNDKASRHFGTKPNNLKMVKEYSKQICKLEGGHHEKSKNAFLDSYTVIISVHIMFG
ncbi:MAG: hypothetical protein ACETWK_09715, partial [Candidatus Aminicenantaceae bacterium]